MLASLRSGSLDAGVLALVEGMSDLDHALILEDPFVAALPRHHALAKKKTVAMADLDEEPVLLLDEGHCLRDQALALCKRAGASETDLRATSLATLVQMVSAGIGVTLLPSIAVDVENRRGQLAIRPLAGKTQGRTIVLAWRKESALSVPLRELARVMARASDKLVA
jgi:LysR family hydrogen peroxide-inducible transcriptional activator